MTKFASKALVGRMAPSIFTYLGVGKKERFPGDPWPHLNALPAWYWMHSDACRDDPAGAVHALYRGKPVSIALCWAVPAEPAAAPAAPDHWQPPMRHQAQPDLFTGTLS